LNIRRFFYAPLFTTKPMVDVIFYKSINLKKTKKINSIMVHTNKTTTMRLIIFFLFSYRHWYNKFIFIVLSRYHVSIPRSLSVSPHAHIIYNNIFIGCFPSKYDGKVYRYFIYTVHTRIILCTYVLYYNIVINLALTACVLRVETTKSTRHLTVSFLYARPINVYTYYLIILCYNTSPRAIIVLVLCIT